MMQALINKLKAIKKLIKIKLVDLFWFQETKILTKDILKPIITKICLMNGKFKIIQTFKTKFHNGRFKVLIMIKNVLYKRIIYN